MHGHIGVSDAPEVSSCFTFLSIFYIAITLQFTTNQFTADYDPTIGTFNLDVLVQV